MAFAITANTIIGDAFDNIGVYQPGPADMQKALRRLNARIGQWALLPLTSTNQSREAFDIIPGKGAPDNPYTIGAGGDFDTTRPITIDGFTTLVTTSVPNFEITNTVIYTDVAYDSIPQKSLQSTYATGLYYNATYEDGLGRIFLYPVPNVANKIVLYRDAQVQGFADLTTSYDLPPGASEVLTLDLSKVLCTPYGRDWSPTLENLLGEYTLIYQRANTRMVDLGLDPALTNKGAGLWNILTDVVSNGNR